MYKSLLYNKKLILFLIIALGASFRFYALDRQSLWEDEMYSLFVCESSIASMVATIWQADVHPPLYSIFLKLWGSLCGTSDWSMRAFSALIGTLCLFPFYRLSSLFLRSKTALFVTFLAAISPLLVYYSQEVRMYSLWLFFLLYSSYFFFHKEEGSRLWLLFSSLALYTHIFTAFFLGMQFVIKLYQKKTLKPFFHLALCSIPLFVWLYMHRHRVAGFQKPFSLASIPYVPFSFVFGYSLGPSLSELHVLSVSEIVQHYVWSLIAPFGLLLALCRPKSKMLCLLVAAGIIGPLLLSLCTSVTFNVRYLLFLLPFFYILLGEAAERRPKVFSYLLSMLMLFSLFQYYSGSKYYRDDVRSLAAFSRKYEELPLLLNRGVASEYAVQHYGGRVRKVWSFSKEAIEEVAKEGRFAVCWQRMWMFSEGKSWYEELHKSPYRVVEKRVCPGIEIEVIEKID